MAVKRDLDSVDGNGVVVNRSNKKLRQYTEDDAKLAGLFEGLASEAKDTRLEAASELVNLCNVEVGKQSVVDAEAFLSENSPSPTLKKIFVRLFRGLCSSRKAARMGFFVALTEVIRITFTRDGNLEQAQPSHNTLLDFALKWTHPDSLTTSQAKRDCQIGRVSALGAILQSEFLFHDQKPNQQFRLVIETLCGIAQQTSWLREECGLIFCEAIRSLARRGCENDYPKAVIQTLCDNNLAKTPEGIALWLEIARHFPQAKLPKKQWHGGGPLSKKEVNNVASILVKGQASRSEDQQSKSQGDRSGSRRYAPHFAWDIVINSLANPRHLSEENADEKPWQQAFSSFWTKSVDDVCFAEGASSERKLLGFQVLEKCIPVLSSSAFPSVLSPKLIKCLMNQSARSDRYLHGAAKSILSTLLSRAKTDPRSASVIVRSLLQRGSLDFDKITSTKTVHSILIHCEEERAVEELLRVYYSAISSPGDDEQRAAERSRATLADQLLNAIKDGHKEKSDAQSPAVIGILKLLADFAYGIEDEAHYGYSTSITPKSREIFRSRLSSCIAHILSLDLTGAIDVPIQIARHIKARTDQGNPVNFKLQEAWACLENICSQTKGKVSANLAVQSNSDPSHNKASSNDNMAVLQAFALLFAVSIIQAYTEDSGDTDALEILQDLQQCYRNIDDSRESTKSFNSIVEILLGFSARQSSLYRRLSEQTFTTFASHVSQIALESMLNVLTQSEDTQGQTALFEQGDVDGESAEANGSIGDDSADSSHGGGDDDVEVVEAEGSSDSSGDDSEDDGRQSAAEESSDDEELQRFDKLLASTLKTSRPDTNNGIESSSSDSSSDESMDDDQMLALDPHLTEIFRQRAAASSNLNESSRKSKRKEQQDAKQNVVNFKNRVLDLLLILVKQRPHDELTLEIILPLLQLIRRTRTRQIADKTSALLRSYFDAAKKKPPHQQQQQSAGSTRTGGSQEQLWQIAKDVHAEALTFASKMHANACSKASLFVARNLLQSPEASGGHERRRSLDGLVDLYAETHKRCLESGSGLSAAFWSDWVSWSFAVGKTGPGQRE